MFAFLLCIRIDVRIRNTNICWKFMFVAPLVFFLFVSHILLLHCSVRCALRIYLQFRNLHVHHQLFIYYHNAGDGDGVGVKRFSEFTKTNYFSFISFRAVCVCGSSIAPRPWYPLRKQQSKIKCSTTRCVAVELRAERLYCIIQPLLPLNAQNSRKIKLATNANRNFCYARIVFFDILPDFGFCVFFFNFRIAIHIAHVESGRELVVFVFHMQCEVSMPTNSI